MQTPFGLRYGMNNDDDNNDDDDDDDDDTDSCNIRGYHYLL
jgi:hypothetical protein